MESEPDFKGLFEDLDVNSNKLTEDNINRIVGLFSERKDREHIAKLIPNLAIASQDYNLSVSTYVEQEDTREKVADILDRIDTLTNDLTAGLPAEIEKRKQQYE